MDFDATQYLKEFNQHLKGKIDSLQSTPEFSHLHCNVKSFIIRNSIGAAKLSLKDNAHAIIHKSRGFVNEINRWFNEDGNLWLNRLPEGCQLNLIVTLREGRKVSQEKSNVEETVSAFIPVSPKYTFEQIILPQEIRKEIDEALNIIKHQDLIYKVWGFESVDPVPKSVLNFYGPPGTGKTMCAHAIAHYLQRPLLSLNYSEIESKYVGEAPKNLQQAFDTAKKNNCVMFFDEADSFLGKRIENVTQGADQALNSLRSQMLILLEEFSGVVLFATNLVTNFDKAFESRILKHIKFELPNEDARIKIISKMLPVTLPFSSPYSEEDLREISKIAEGFSGREIKNAILETLLAKASKEGREAIFFLQDFLERFKQKKTELERLKQEAQQRTTAKIKAAIERKGQTSQDTGKEDTLEN